MHVIFEERKGFQQNISISYLILNIFDRPPSALR